MMGKVNQFRDIVFFSRLPRNRSCVIPASVCRGDHLWRPTQTAAAKEEGTFYRRCQSLDDKRSNPTAAAAIIILQKVFFLP